MMVRDIKVVYGEAKDDGNGEAKRMDCARIAAAGCRAWGICSMPQERMVVLHLSAAHEVLGIQEVARGGLTSVTVHPREVFRGAIVAGAAAVILAHNHPSGHARMSADDRALTKRMKDAGELIGVPVLDHVVVTEDSYSSHMEDGE